MAKGIMERLAEGVVLGDGGYVQEMGKRGVVQEGPYTPEVCIRYPDSVRELHWEFLHCGAEVLQAMAFYGSRSHLEYVGLGDRVKEVNRAAVRLAREVAGDRALVAGNLSTTWRYVKGDPDSRKEVRQQLREQLEIQADEGVDFVISEFIFHLGEALIALECTKELGLPAMITLTFEDHLRTKDGATPAQCARKLVAEGADIVGTNCGRGP
ncbi:MAG: homocysteine S-methyltransferase family protein, partial [Dehalococcoidia bacterium]